MAHYYFDLVNGDGPVRDDQGQDMASRLDLAREVSRILADIARDELPGRARGDIAINVRDASGRAVLTGKLCFHTTWHDEAD